MGNPLRTSDPISQFRSDFASFKQNPMQFLINKKLNIPQEYQGDPERMVKYLLDTGQMSQAAYSQYSNLVNGMNQ